MHTPLPPLCHVSGSPLPRSSTCLHDPCHAWCLQDYINKNVQRFKVNLPGWEDYVGDSRVMGPTMEPQEVGAHKCKHVRYWGSSGNTVLP